MAIMYWVNEGNDLVHSAGGHPAAERDNPSASHAAHRPGTEAWIETLSVGEHPQGSARPRRRSESQGVPQEDDAEPSPTTG